MKTEISKTEKRLKKEKSMFSNMITHFKANGIKSIELIPIEILKDIAKEPTFEQPEDPNNPNPKPIEKEKEPEPTEKEYKVIGSHTTNKKFKFELTIHPEDTNENGHLQVLLHMECKPDHYITMRPQTNGQLLFMVNNFEVGLIEPKTEEPLLETNSTTTKQSTKKK